MPEPLSNAPRRWVVVADSPFVPAQGGGEREHLGFVEAAVKAELVRALVVPIDSNPTAVGRQDDLGAIRHLIEPAPLITVPRRRSPVHALVSRHPYVVASRPVPRNLVNRVRREVPDADAVIVFSYKSHALGRALAVGLGLPAVLRHHNLEGAYHHALAASASPPRSWLVHLEAFRIGRDERRLERSAWLRGIADISATDAAVRSARSRVPVRYIPSFALGNRSTTLTPSWTPGGGATVVFLGALDIATNHDALAWFAAEVWPKVRARCPDARWQVVGRKPTEAVRELVVRTPGAELRADVADPTEYLRSAAVAVNPAVSGSGVNIKLVEYLAFGVPVVSTTRGMAGLGLTAGADLMVADRADTFADRLIELLSSEDLAWKIGSRGRASALQILDVSASLAALTRLLAG